LLDLEYLKPLGIRRPSLGELPDFYALPAHDFFTVHSVNETNRHSRNAYKAAIAAIEATMPQVTKYWRQPLIMWRSAFCLG